MASQITLTNEDTHATPSTGRTALYVKADKKAYVKTDAGVEAELGAGAAPAAHASSHITGDAIQDATASQKGLATGTQITKLDGITAQADVTNASTVAAAGAVMKSLATTKGDLFVATAAGVIARLPAGTNGYALVADSTESLGVKWVAMSATSFPNEQFYADQLQTPLTDDWPVEVNAGMAPDTLNEGIPVLKFDSATEEAAGFLYQIPTGATNIKIRFKSRAQILPASAKKAAVKFYRSGYPDNTAEETWVGYSLDDIDLPTNLYWQEDEQTIALATLGLVAGRFTRMQFSRNVASGNDTLVGDWTVAMIGLGFS